MITESSPSPLCFVLMPFGTKTDFLGRTIDFDAVYETVFKPAIVAADMEPLRADEERDGGFIHKPMFERLVLCPFAVADLTLANANVFYELGVRHAVRPHTTVLVYEKGGQRLPFDVSPLRALPYNVDEDGDMVDAASSVGQVTSRLQDARDPAPDSPLFQLLDGFEGPDVARLKTDVFRDRVRYNQAIKAKLATARRSGVEAVREVHEELSPIADQEAGVVVDLLLSYRDASDHGGMVKVVSEMAPPLANTVLAQEQLAFALNRLGRGAEAEVILTTIIEEHGPTSETLGLLGRVYKDRWETSRAEGGSHESAAHLRRAIDTYRLGFEADWRDHYPGVNAVTLSAVAGDTAAVAELLPVVTYSARRRVETGRADYWDLATLVELSVIAGDFEGARRYLGEGLAIGPARWQKETTARNLRLLTDAQIDGSTRERIEQIAAELEAG